MTRRALPLLADALPLYATKAQIVAVMAGTAEGQKAAGYMFAMSGFPQPSAFVAGHYYAPAVMAFVEEYEARRAPAKGSAASWQETSKRRA